MPATTTSHKMPSLVLVTGANGYVGCMAVKILLEQGYRVRGTVRDPTNVEKTQDLKSLPHADTHLELVPLDLLGSPESFEQAMKDVEWCFHMAAPVTIQSQKDEDQIMIRPTVEGTLSLLRAAQQTPTLKKFILTSSSCTIEQGNTADSRDPTQPFTEADWTNLEGPGLNAYDKSKTLAEKEAWKFMNEHPKLHFTLSSINPTYVLGPVASSQAGTSTELIARPMRAVDPGSINLWLQFVDVREVVQAHIRAARCEKASGQRFILSNSEDGEMFMPQMVSILRDEFGPMGYTLRPWIIPKWIVWLLSFVDADIASVYPLVNNDSRRFDNSKSQRILNLQYRPVQQTILEGAHSMIAHGIIERKPGYRQPQELR